MSDIYNDDMITLINLLEEIILDEFMVVNVNPDSGVAMVYQHFLNRLKYEYRWFGVRAVHEFTTKWQDLRAEFSAPDSEFKDGNPSTQVVLITTITQRLVAMTDFAIWDDDEWLIDTLIEMLFVYNLDSLNEDEDVTDADKIYDDQIATTMSRHQVRQILGKNKWLVVAMLISFISNRCVLTALGYVNDTVSE